MSGSVLELLARVEALDIRLWVDGDRLRYEGPEGALTSELADALRKHRAELIERLRRDSAAPEPIRPRTITGDAPLSFAQQRLWLLDQLGAGSAYNIHLATRLVGQLDVAALKAAIHAIVDRHEALRTSFPSVDGNPVQRIAPTLDVFESIDLRHLAEGERERQAHTLADAEILRAFDVEHGPLVRFRLYRLDDDDQVLLVTVHHIIFDAWSVGVFKRELSEHYRAFTKGQTPSVGDLPLQYADFAVWQRDSLHGATLDGLLAYWQERLGTDLPELNLPTDRPRLAIQSFQGGLHTLQVPRGLWSAVEMLSQDAGVTPAMTLLAVFNVLLARYTRQDEIVVGSPIAGRNNAESEDLLGSFVNALVFRTDVSGDPTFSELLARVREVSLGAYDHQDLPFERLVEELKPERDPSRSPIFQVMFAVQNTPPAELVLPGVDVLPFDLGVMTTRFDLEVHLDAVAGGLRVRMIYAKQLFDSETIERLMRHYVRLLEEAVGHPGVPISELPLLDQSERRRILVDWNRTSTDYPRDATVPALFAQQAARTPDAVALEFAADRVTYAELNRRANQVAHHLQRRGVGPGTLVAICVDRSIDFIVGLLGILKSGAAYVPLDPQYPAPRLAAMLEETQAPLLLAHEAVLDDLPEHGAETICLDRDWPAFAAEPDTNPAWDGGAEDLAYVMYTSGSTGRPKGVCVPHRAIARLVLETNYVDLQPSDRIAQASNVSFDAATFEIWGALLNGAAVVGIKKDAMLSPAQFGRELRKRRISVLFITTALFNQLVEASPGVFASLRYLLFGGEAVDPSRVRAVLAHGAPEHLLHVYGPTESTTYATWHEVTEVAEGATTVPIGRPLANTTMYVLDGQMQPVPVGVPGELYLGGDGLAQGYLASPALSADRFPPSPFEGHGGGRLYRTGDLVRYRADGSIDFVGRTDAQVKVRGFRIEPGEIEAALCRHDAVREAVVQCREDEPGEKRLVAYVVSGDEDVPAAALRGHLRETLPDYMIPAAFVALESLPLTPNGKVDHKALPAPEGDRQVEEAYVAPRSEVEARIAAIWREVLGIEQVGVHDNFFELGGHSLLATQVVSRMRATFDVEMPLQAILGNSTIEDLAGFVQGAEAEAIKSAPIVPLPRDGDLPLSFAQQRLWFLDQLYPGRFGYNQPFALRLRGELDRVALEESLDELIRRHEPLRTAIRSEDGVPRQVILDPQPRGLPLVDLTDRPVAQREGAARQLAVEEMKRPFELSAGRPMRAQLLQLDDRDHVLLLTLHHIVSDGWSLGVLHRELGAIYAAFARGEPSPLAPLAVQYADFAAWQRQWLSGSVWEEQLRYWKTQLADVAPLELPTDRPRPTEQTFAAACEQVVLPKRLAEAIDALGRRESATPFMTLFTAFTVLLRRYTGQDDIVVGSPIANRNRIEIEPLIGFFVNSLVMRADLSGAPTFRELLGRVRLAALGAFEHQDIPFEHLVEELQPERDLGRSPIFQVLFAVQNAGEGSLALSGIEVSDFDRSATTTRFDLELHVNRSDGQLSAEFVYNTDLFEAATIERMAGHFRTLLEGIAANPGARLFELPMLSAPERERVLVEWNCTARDYSQDSTLHERFEEQAARTPEAIALAFGDQALTYAELNARANQLARLLRSKSVGPEVPVGVFMERSLEMVVSLYGILKAGGAYVPLDPEDPKTRLLHMLSAARVPVLLTQSKLAVQVPDEAGSEIIRLDADWRAIAGEDDGPVRSDARPDNLAYVIFTSGSTGAPKGAMNTHRAICNRLDWMQEAYGLTAADRVLQKTPYSFDVSVWEFFWPLRVGAKLVVAPPGAQRDPGELVRVIGERGITTVHFVPSMLQAFLDAEDLTPARCLQRVICSGEALAPALHDRFFGALDAELHNLYGPTEAAIDVTSHPCAPADGQGRIPIGRPVANTQIYLLDEALRPTPLGVRGHLHIGGVQVGRGYLGRPALTADRFIPDPFSQQPGARLYATGDLARYRADGTIDFLGRIDHQVKVRGHRIELGEIESVLGRHSAVQEVVAVVWDHGADDRRLVAYVTGDVADCAEALRDWTRERLPGYMVPATVVPVEAFPLTPSGKVDRKALAAMTPTALATAGFVAPRDPTEEAVAAIFAELLECDRVGVHDGFFDLGGHSLLGTRVIARLRKVFEIDLAVSVLFESPTVASLAERVDAARGSDHAVAGSAAIVPIARDGGDLPLSFAEQRLWFLAQMDTGAGYNMPSAIRATGALDVAALERSLRSIAQRHEVLRTTFPAADGKPRVAIAAEAELSLPVIDRTGLGVNEREAVIDELALAEAHAPFDLARGPIARATLIRLDDHDHVILVTFHHIIGDGWSQGVFTRELMAHYRAYVQGGEPDVPALPVQYVDFAAWQRSWLRGDEFERQLAYWEEQLRDLPVLSLPTDRPRPSVPTFEGAARPFELSPELLHAVHALARREGVTPAMCLLATFQVLLARYSGSDDVVVGSPIANRVHPDLENLIGFFVNTLVLRADLSGDPTFVEVLRRVRKTSLGAYDHQDLPFERLVDEIEPERDASRNPLFQVAFMLQNMPRVDLDLQGLTLAQAPLQIRSVRVDLELHLFEVGEGIQGRAIYSTDLFDATTIDRMLHHYVRLLESAVATPEARVSLMTLLEDDERRVLLHEWNATEAAYPDDRCMHELFEARVVEAPNAVAVVAGDVELTYAELNARANQVAHTLRARGVGPDTLVGLCTDRSPDMVVGLLGILKSGGAYLPLDPTYPRERLAFMLEDSGAAVLLTQQALLDALPDRGGLTLCLDRDGGTFAEAPEQNPALVTRPNHLAYSIYTSGSTGRPKGALVAHGGLVSLSEEQARAFGAGPGSRVLQFSSLSFDASSFEVVMALPKGATLVLGHREELLPGPDLLRFIRERRISIVTLPPTALAALPVEDLPDLKTITVAGEACSADLVSRWAPGRKFFNLYGPTEATIWSTMAELRPGEAAHIGRPIGNVRVYVLDAHGRVVPVGVPGELHIGGISVARGYLNRPALTAERFVPDPFGGADGARLYRSGDLVRYRADGNLEFLGRIDEQVKLRGFRIELGEIEAMLDEHPAVRESVAMVREDVADDRRLVAYVRCDEDVELVSPETDASGWQDDHVAHWQTLYDQSYAAHETPAEAAFNIAGWNSSYTGDPIPADEMREWVENTVARIRSTGPQRVLEMGCGTGLLLLRLVPHCTEYVGADFSQPALDYVAQQLDRMGDDGAKARLECRTADDYDGLPGGHFDTVVLNSVVQYFPSAEYLRQVLEGAVSRVPPGGRIFVGDVRSLPLLEAFHASVQLERAPGETTREQLRLRVHHEMNQDQELVIDPSFFATLAADIDAISHVELEPKRGRYDNELSRFRYDVVVHVGDGGAAEATGAASLTWRTWDDASMTLPRLLAQLEEERPSTLAFSDVPNRRVADDVEIAALLEREECPTTTDALREHLDGSSHRAHGVEPDELRVAGETLGYDVFVSVSGGRSDGSFDVVLAQREDKVPSDRIWRSMPAPAVRTAGAEATNRPLRGRFLRELVPHLRQHASERLPEYMVPSVFTVLDTFPLTPNGKVDRRALPVPDALRPELRVAYEPPRSALEETLARIWVQVLGVDRVGAHDNFFELGGDSMLSIQVVALAREAGVGISARDLFQHQTVAELTAAAGAMVVTAEQGVVTGDVPLTPIASWFFEQDLADAHHFNQAVMLTADQGFDVDQLETVLAHLATHHDALRLRARHAVDGWTLTLVAPGDPVPVEVVDLPTVPVEEQPALVEREAARVQASLDLGAGPLIRCAIFRGGAAPNGEAERLLITIHHLAVDVVSWGVLLEDLARGLEQQRAGQPLSLPAKTTSIREWATRLEEHAQRAEVAEQAAYWLDLPWSKAATLPVDDAQGENTIESVRSAPAVLDEQQTRAVLHEVPAAFNATVEEVLLAALAMACAAETNGAWTLVDLEGHGREEFADDVDVSRTVGWFTSIHPVLLHAEPGAGAGAVLRTVKEQLRAVPGHGMPFGMARYLARDPAVSRGLNALPQAQIAFNYLGRFDRMTARAGWDVSTQDVGPSRSPRGRRQHLLEVSGGVLQGRLRMGFGYSTSVHRDATIERLAGRYAAALIQLIEASRSGRESAYTASDLAEVGWSAEDVDELLDEM